VLRSGHIAPLIFLGGAYDKEILGADKIYLECAIMVVSFICLGFISLGLWRKKW
jgi:hypothetical protein